MRKRLIIELEDDDFRAMLGALLKTGADFRVEAVGDEEPVRRTLMRKTEDGLTPADVLLEAVRKNHKVHVSNLPVLGKDHGFALSTLNAKASKLVKEGVLRRDGQYLLEVKS